MASPSLHVPITSEQLTGLCPSDQLPAQPAWLPQKTTQKNSSKRGGTGVEIWRDTTKWFSIPPSILQTLLTAHKGRPFGQGALIRNSGKAQTNLTRSASTRGWSGMEGGEERQKDASAPPSPATSTPGALPTAASELQGLSVGSAPLELCILAQSVLQSCKWHFAQATRFAT